MPCCRKHKLPLVKLSMQRRGPERALSCGCESVLSPRFLGAYPPKQGSKPSSQIESWSTINPWSFYQISECRVPLNKRKAPSLNPFWRRFWSDWGFRPTCKDWSRITFANLLANIYRPCKCLTEMRRFKTFKLFGFTVSDDSITLELPCI